MPADEREAILDLADQAIGLLLEYRDQHGYDEEAARRAAARDVAEGATADAPGSPGWHLAPPGAVVVELPEPDCHVNAVTDQGEDSYVASWEDLWHGSITAWNEGVEVDGDLRDRDVVERSALIWLAAARRSAQYAREATPAPETGGQR